MNPMWISEFERLMAGAFNAAQKIKLDKSEAGRADWLASPEVNRLWEFANSSVGEVSISFEGQKLPWA